jgi:hypothetical protein
MHGTVDSILQTQSKVAKETQRLARRREKQQEQMAAEYTMPEVALAAAPAADPEVPVQVETVEAKDNSNNEVKRWVTTESSSLMTGIVNTLLC